MFGSASGAEGVPANPLHNQEREWFAKGQESIAFGKYDDAILYFKKVLAVNPDFSDVYRFLGDVYMKKNMPDDAIQSYTKALASKAQTVPPLFGLGKCYVQKGMPDEAFESYRRALSLQPENAAAHIGLGDVYHEKRENVSAIAEYRKGLALEPDNAEAHLTMGFIFQEQGEPNAASQHFYQAKMLFIKKGIRTNALRAYDCLKQTKAEKLEKLLYDALQPSPP